MIDYQAIRLYHRIDGIQNLEETQRRLREVAENAYSRNPRCKALCKVLNRKSGMNETELEVLKNFPIHGINIGYLSNGLIFTDALWRSSLAYHKAVVSLMKQGKLCIVEGYRIDTDKRDRMEQVIVKCAS